ncbi:putative oxoglutarate dehydrogenase [Tanacetum coccineum]
MDNTVYLVEHCTRKDAPIRSPTGIGAGLREHLAPMERSNNIPVGDRGEFGACFVMSPYEQLFAYVMFARGTAGFVSVYLNEATQGCRNVLLVAGIALLFSASKFSNREDVALDMSRRVKGNSQEWLHFIVLSQSKGVNE